VFEQHPFQPVSMPLCLAVHDRSTGASTGERIGIHPRMLTRMGAEPRQQARVSHGGTTALFTLIPDTDVEEVDTIRITESGCRRLGAAPGQTVILDFRCIDPAMTEKEAEIEGEFIERLEDDGRHHRLVVLAPHGGAIETRTDQQAEQVVASLGSHDSTLWACKWWGPIGNAYRAWHISSTDLSVHSFPLLRSLSARGFQWALSFHGYRGNDVLIGGLAPARLKSDLRNAIAKAVDGSGIRVRVAHPGERYCGESASNLVNRLTADAAGGIQIEQSRPARMLHGRAIAAAVSEVYDSWIAADNRR